MHRNSADGLAGGHAEGSAEKRARRPRSESVDKCCTKQQPQEGHRSLGNEDGAQRFPSEVTRITQLGI